MGSSFGSAVDRWHDFYMLAGTASESLVGLLFVSVSLHADLITDPTAAGVLASARRAFGSFILILLIALVFVIPAQSPHGLGIPLIIFSFSSMLQTASAARIRWRERTRLLDLLGSASDLGRLGMGAVSGLGLLAVALTILGGSTAYIDWLVGVIGVLLVGAARSAWDLLLELAMAKRRIAASQPAADAAVGSASATVPSP